MMGTAKKTGRASERPERSTERPPGGHSEARVKTVKKWSPTLPSVADESHGPDAIAEAHAALAEARAALDTAVLALDRIKRRR